MRVYRRPSQVGSRNIGAPVSASSFPQSVSRIAHKDAAAAVTGVAAAIVRTQYGILEMLGIDCLQNVFLHADLVTATALRACCSQLRDITLDPTFRKTWAMVNSHEIKKRKALQRAAAHYASLDAMQLECEPCDKIPVPRYQQRPAPIMGLTGRGVVDLRAQASYFKSLEDDVLEEVVE